MRIRIFLLVLIAIFIGVVGNHDCEASTDCKSMMYVVVGSKLKPHTYAIQYPMDIHTGMSGMNNAVMVLAKGEFTQPGRFGGIITYHREGSIDILVDGYKHSVPLLKECK